MNKIIISAFVLIACGCGGTPKLDPASLQISSSDTEMVSIPDTCKSFYRFDKPRVAVAEFLNNTSYGDMQASNTSLSGRARSNTVGVGVSKDIGRKTTVGAGAAQTNTSFTGQADTYMRDVAPKIGEYAQSATENIVSGIGGMQIYDRSSLSKILNEQKFQMSIADPDTAVEAGKLAGVQYIFTGTVDAINAKYTAPLQESNTGNGWVDLAVNLARVASSPVTGWNVSVEMSIKMLDVETGNVILNRKIAGSQYAGGGQGMNPDLIAEAAKKAMGKAIQDIKPELIQRFSPKGYIKQLRGNKTAALINIGSNNGIKEGEQLEAYDFMEITDPFSGEKTCNMIRIPVEVTVSNEIAVDHAWVCIDGNKTSTSRIKIGTIIKRK